MSIYEDLLLKLKGFDGVEKTEIFANSELTKQTKGASVSYVSSEPVQIQEKRRMKHSTPQSISTTDQT